jgi:xanthine/CO dehydrogenase XdhC/CoxF family maturation factor
MSKRRPSKRRLLPPSPAQYPSLVSEVYEEMARALENGAPLVVATVAASRGSTPRSPGAKMAVRQDGSFCGTIGGGCGEAEVWQAAMDTMRDGEPRLVTVDLTEDVEGEDKICGGVMDVFVERLPGGAAEPRT